MAISAPAKLLHVMGVTEKEEATYGTAIALTTTADGFQLQYTDRNQGAPMTWDWAFGGEMGPSVGNLGQVQRVASAGLSISGSLPTRARGGGAAYSASVVPSIHRALKASGFDATVTTTSSSEKWVYTPMAPGTGYTSLTRNLYTRGELWTQTGVIQNAKMEFADPKPPIWTFDSSAIGTLPTDVACPTITYPLQTSAPPLASSVTFTMGSLVANAVVMSGSFDMQREKTPRVPVSGGAAHLGFVPGDRSPIIKVVLEATALVATPFTSSTAFDPYGLKNAGTSFAFSLRFGSTQYFRYTIAFTQAQVSAIALQNNGPIALTELTIAAYNSTAVAADDVVITFD